MRRAVAIQLIINRELGSELLTQNPWQGSFIVSEYLTDLVEDGRCIEEFDADLAERGGVLGAMDTMYQRSKIQEESLYYEQLKHSGELPLIGVNTYLPRDGKGEQIDDIELMRSTDAEKQVQIDTVHAFQARTSDRRPEVLAHLQDVARERGNVFEALMEAVKVASLGQISQALYEVGGEYRRNM